MNIAEKFINTHELTKEEYVELIRLAESDVQVREQLKEEAVRLQKKYYGTDVYTRGLIEFTNYCRNNCYYCGIRNGNRNAQRYRLTKEEILDCCANGYELGFRTFVLYPECAITLSVGEHSKETYRLWKEAGADRYLLRHETASDELYQKLHPAEMKLSERKQCLYDLKELGYQVGAGFMVGAPGQQISDLAEDLVFLKELEPHMVGIGPFIPHHDTRYAEEKAGSVERTLLLLSIIRILLPGVLLPATTALGTMDPLGREKGLQAGANVVMPNLSPVKNRKQYELYDNKICTGEEAAECRGCLSRRVASVGYRLVSDRGDSRM